MSQNTDVVHPPTTPHTEPTRVAAAVLYDDDTAPMEDVRGISKGLFVQQQHQDGEDELLSTESRPRSQLGMKRSRSPAMGMGPDQDGEEGPIRNSGDVPLLNSTTTKKLPAPIRLVQTHLDFGQSLAPKHCCHCGMRFDVCDEDQAVHRRVCTALRKPAQPAQRATGPILLPLNPFIADIKAAKAAGVASKTQIRNPNAPTTVSTATPRRATGKGRTSGSGCDMDLLAALKPGSMSQSDLHSSNGIEAIATSTTTVDGRTYYLIDTGAYHDWVNFVMKRESSQQNSTSTDIITSYMRTQWGGCICSTFAYKVLLLLRIPTSDEITSATKKLHGATTSVIEVVGSINYRPNEDRVHEPLLYSNMVPTVRTLAYVDTTDNPQLHPFAFHPQDGIDTIHAPSTTTTRDGRRTRMPSSLQQPLCWRDEGYVRGRKLREVGDLIPLSIHTPTTLVDIGGVHFLAAAFEPKKAKKSVMDFFSKAPPAATSTLTPTSLLPLLDAALRACMAVCGVGAAHRVVNTCAFVKRQCDLVTLGSAWGAGREEGEEGREMVSSLMKLWEEAEESLAANDQRKKIHTLANEAHLFTALSDTFIDGVVSRRLMELPVITYYSRWEECPTTTQFAYPDASEL